MEIILYIQHNIFEADLAIAYTMFSKIPHTNIRVVGLTKGDYYTVSGVGISVSAGIDTVDHADLLIVMGDERSGDTSNANLNQWLERLANSARCVVGLSSGAVQLLNAGLLVDDELTYPVYYTKAFKKLSQKALPSRCVVSSKYITTSMPSATYGALLLAANMVYGNSTVSSICIGDKSVDLTALTAMDKRRYKTYKQAYTKFIKRRDYAKKHPDKEAVVYLFDDMRAFDVLMTVATLSHLPYKINFISNSVGKIFVEGGGFKIVADKAIQHFYQSDLLVIGGGQSIAQCLVSEYLTHWIKKIAPSSFRVLTIAEGEQMLGVSGVLIDVNIDVLNNLPLGEGKYLMVKDAYKAQQSILYIGHNEHQVNIEDYQKYYGLY